MHNSNDTTGADKISFVRSKFKPQSLASEIMHANSFTPCFINYDDDKFRENFLQAFGHFKHHNSLGWDFCTADSLVTKHGTASYLLAQESTANLVPEDADSLKRAFWFHKGTLENVSTPT